MSGICCFLIGDLFNRVLRLNNLPSPLKCTQAIVHTFQMSKLEKFLKERLYQIDTLENCFPDHMLSDVNLLFNSFNMM